MSTVSVTLPRWKPLVILAMLLTTASALSAQTPPPRDSRLPTQTQAPTRDRPPVRTTGTAVVKGRVVDGVSGSAIARARVRLIGSPAPVPSVLTDGEGAFVFTKLPPGSFTVMADKSTYMTGRYPDSARTLRSRMTPNLVSDGQVSDVTIKMFHGGAITGRVVDAYGDPLEWADVRAMFIPRGRAPTMRNSAQTNDLGEFRLSRLEPGRYVLSVTPRNTSSDEAFNRGATPTQAQPLPQPTPTYYPGAASPDEAQALVINRGATISGVEIVLGEGIPTIVTGVVMGPDGPLSSPNGNISVRHALTGSGGGNPFVAGTGLGQDGSFRLQIHPGQYILEGRVSPQLAPGEPYQPNREMVGTIPLTVAAGGVESVTIVVGKPASATGRVIFEGTSPPPAAPVGRPQYVPVSGEEGGTCRVGQAIVAEDWTFKIDNLVGTCTGSSTNMFGRWTLKSVRIGGVNALEKSVTFEPGRQYTNVEILVTDKPSQIELRVAGDDGQPTREYAALAFPVDKAAWKRGPQVARPMVPRTTPLIAPPGMPLPPMFANGPDGQPRDVINGLKAGEYYVIALDDIDAEDVYDPTVWEKLSQHATRISLGTEGVVEVSLQRMKTADLVR